MHFRFLLLALLSGCAHSSSDRLPASTINKFCEADIAYANGSKGMLVKMSLAGKVRDLKGTLVTIEKGNDRPVVSELYSGVSEEFSIRPDLLRIKNRIQANPPLNRGEFVIHKAAELLLKNPEMKIKFGLGEVTMVRLNMGQYNGGVASFPNYIVEAYGKGINREGNHLGNFIHFSEFFVSSCK